MPWRECAAVKWRLYRNAWQGQEQEIGALTSLEITSKIQVLSRPLEPIQAAYVIPSSWSLIDKYVLPGNDKNGIATPIQCT